jgi:hypothetical protein
MWKKKRLSRVVGSGALNTTLTAGSSSRGSGETPTFGFYASGSSTLTSKIGSSMAFDNQGKLYVTNKGTASIDKISFKKNRNNTIVTQIAGTSNITSSIDITGNNSDSKITLGSTTGIAIDSNDNKYVVDSTNHVINKIDTNGLMTKLSGTHGTSGNTTTSNFNNPTSIEMVGTDLYVADKGNKAIRKINTADGSITSSKILGGTASDAPESITYNSADNTIYWVNGGNNIKGYDLTTDGIVEVTTNTTPGFVDTSTPYTTEGNPDMKFNKITSIASDHLGNLYVSDHDNARIRQIYKDPISAGTHTFTFANPSSGYDEYVVSTSGNGWHLGGDLSSQDDPTIYLRKGDTYIFDRPDATHQLNFIKKGNTSWSTANSLGTTNNTAISYSKNDNDITITIPSNFSGISTSNGGDGFTYEMEFQYVCEAHSNMRGTIKIIDKDFIWKSKTIVGDGTVADKDNVEDDGDFQIKKPLSVQVNNEEGSIYILDESNKIKKIEYVFDPDDTKERNMIKETGLTDSLVNTLKTFKLNGGKLGTVSGSTHTEADKLEQEKSNLWDSATNIASGDSNAVKLEKNQKKYKRRRGIAKYLFKTNQGEETFKTTHDAMGLNTISGWTKTKVKVFKPRDMDDDPIEIDINAVLQEDAEQGYYCPLDINEACKMKPRGTGVKDFKITKDSSGKYIITNATDLENLSIIAGNGSSYDTTSKFEDGDVAIIEGEPIVFGGVEGTGDDSTFCFLAGTVINTDQGNIPIEKITNKNSINGLQVVAIVKTRNTTRRMIRVDKDAFGKNIPNKDTIMTRKHAIRLNNKWVTALKLANEGKNRKVYKIVRPRKEILYNVLLDSYEKIYANNMPVESLHPRTKLATFYKNFILNESKISSK